MTAQEEYIEFLNYGERATVVAGSSTPAPDSPVNAKVNSLGRSTSEAAPFFERLRKAMLEKLAEIELRQQAPIVERVAEAEEQAAILAHNENQAVLLESDRRIAERIILALERIRRQEFGICDSCEMAIPEKRLRAIPWASLCVKCAETCGDSRGPRLP